MSTSQYQYQSSNEPIDLSNFRDVFPRDESKFPYNKPRISKIIRQRTLLDNTLFYDLLLRDHLHGLKSVGDLYPPKSTAALQTLFHTIMESRTDALKNYSFIYYLLKEYREYLEEQKRQTHCPFAKRYAAIAHIPSHFVSMMDAIWALDNSDFETAILHLSDPAVIPPYPDKILSTLLRFGNANIAITFVQVTQPSLLSDSSVITYFNALKLVSIESAFFYQRTAPQHFRENLFKSLVDHALTNKREENAMILINLPLNLEEQALLESYLKTSNISPAKDTLLIKHIHQGQLTEIIPELSSMTRLNEPRLAGMNWGDLSKGISLGMGPRTSEYH